MNAGLGQCVGSLSIPGARHRALEGVLGLDLSSCSSGPLRVPQGAVAPSCWASRDLPGRRLEWGEGVADLPFEPIPNKGAPGMMPQPQAPMASSSSQPGYQGSPQP